MVGKFALRAPKERAQRPGPAPVTVSILAKKQMRACVCRGVVIYIPARNVCTCCVCVGSFSILITPATRHQLNSPMCRHLLLLPAAAPAVVGAAAPSAVCEPGYAGVDCDECPAGSYSAGGPAATSTCEPCGEGLSAPPGSTDASACQRKSPTPLSLGFLCSSNLQQAFYLSF